MYNGSPASASMSFKILNKMTSPLLVQQRGVINYIVPGIKEPSYSNEVSLSVTLDVHIPNMVLFDPDAQLNPLDKDIITELEKAIDRETENHYLTTHSIVTITVVVPLTDKHAVGPDKTIVSEVLGITLGQDVDSKKRSFSKDSANYGLSELKKDVKKEMNDGELVMGIKLVDRNNFTSNLWVNVFGSPAIIPKNNSGEIPDGLYIISCNNQSGNETTFIPIHELNNDIFTQYGIYDSKIAALAGGHNKFIQELQSKVSSSRDELEKQKSILKSNDIKFLTLLQEHNGLKQQTALFKQQQKIVEERNKTQLETIKTKQGATSAGEFIKSVVSIAGVAFTGLKLLG